MLRSTLDHERCWELIPWVVNERASETERYTVLGHVEHCRECRDELARHRGLLQHMRSEDDVIPAPNAAWQKLLARIDAPAQASAAGSHRLRRPWLVAALWIQFVAIAVLAGALFRASPTTGYATLSSSAAVESRPAVRVVFAPGTTLEAINQLLRSVECEITAGPSEAGVYTLAVAGSADLHGTIAALRQRPEILFAERGR